MKVEDDPRQPDGREQRMPPGDRILQPRPTAGAGTLPPGPAAGSAPVSAPRAAPAPAPVPAARRSGTPPAPLASSGSPITVTASPAPSASQITSNRNPVMPNGRLDSRYAISRHVLPLSGPRGGGNETPSGASSAASAARGRELSVMRPACPAAAPCAMGWLGSWGWGFPHHPLSFAPPSAVGRAGHRVGGGPYRVARGNGKGERAVECAGCVGRPFIAGRTADGPRAPGARPTGSNAGAASAW